jgi:predicted esterase
MANPANKNTEIFQAHGRRDSVVRYQWGELSRKVLEEKLGNKVEWHSYPELEHSADPQEIAHMEKWLENKLPAQGPA